MSEETKAVVNFILLNLWVALHIVLGLKILEALYIGMPLPPLVLVLFVLETAMLVIAIDMMLKVYKK